MIDYLKPYPIYKDSGVPWLGEVPQHWTFERLDRLFTIRGEVPLPSDQRVTGYLNGRVTLRSNVAGQKIKGVVKEAGWQRVHPGDFAISGMNAHLGGMGVSDALGKCSPIYLVLKPKSSTNAHFVSHAARYAASVGALKALVNTVRFNSADFKRDDLKLIWLCLPSRAEQAAVVRFIDHAERRIRRYLRSKKKLMTLLSEQKQASVHRMVTQGVNPTVRLKSSGVRWLGDLPEHWQILPARYLFRAVTRRDIHGDEVKLSVTQRQGLVPTDKMEESSTQASSFDRFQICEPGDLVLNKYKAHLGVFWAARCRGLVTPNYTVFRPLREMSATYFELLFHTSAYKDAFAMTVQGVTEGMSPLYTQDFYATPVVMPPASEQQLIVSKIAEQTATEDRAIARTEREIKLVGEYRTRLIADVVTGKLDIREAAARLPDERDEPDPRDDADASPEDDDDAAADETPEEAEA